MTETKTMGEFWFLVRQGKLRCGIPYDDALMRSITSPQRDMDGVGVVNGTVRFSGPPSAIRFKALYSLPVIGLRFSKGANPAQICAPRSTGAFMTNHFTSYVPCPI